MKRSARAILVAAAAAAMASCCGAPPPAGPPGALAGYIFPVRDLFMAGEIVNILSITRRSGGLEAAQVPVEIRVINPRGNAVVKMNGTTDAYGLIAFSLKTESLPVNGEYTLEMGAGGRTLTRRTFKVAEFIEGTEGSAGRPPPENSAHSNACGGGLKIRAVFPGRTGSRRDMEVVLMGNSRFSAAIAIVDETLLKASGFRPPDPCRSISEGANAYEQSGAAAGEAAVLSDPAFRKMVYFWTGPKESDRKGRLSATFRIPEFSGRLKVMYIAADARGIASGSGTVEVADDVRISAETPRFAHSGDSFSFSISLENKTAVEARVSLSATAKHATVNSAPAESVILPPLTEKTLWPEAAAAGKPGYMELILSSAAPGPPFTDVLTLPVRSSLPRTSGTAFSTVDPGGTDLAPFLEGWRLEGLSTHIMLSPIVVVTRLFLVNHLLNADHNNSAIAAGTVLALARLGGLMPIASPSLHAAGLHKRISSGVTWLASLQTDSGGFGLWPSDLAADRRWTEIAVLALLEAAAAGYQVPAETLTASLMYLEKAARSGNSGALGLYILAREGRLQQKDKSWGSSLPPDEKAWFAAALNASGKRRESEEVLASASREIMKVKRKGIAALAAVLYSMELLHPGSPANGPVAEKLAGELGAEPASIPLEGLTMGVLALGARVLNSEPPPRFSAVLTGGRKRLMHDENAYGKAWLVHDHELPLSMDIRSETPLIMVVENTGHRISVKEKAISESLSLQRRFTDPTGRELSEIKAGQRLLVEAALKNPTGRNLKDMVVEIPIPAGMIFEGPGSAGSGWKPSFSEIRGHKAVFIGAALSRETTFTVHARAVFPGTYHLPPATAHMDDEPGIRASTEAGKICLLP